MTLALVSGTGRSGTTLVQEILSRHPAVGFISGLDDKLPRLNLAGRLNGTLYRRTAPRDPRMRALTESVRVLERGRTRVAPSEAYRLIDRQVMAGFSKPCRDLLAEDMTPYLQGRFRDFFGARMAAQGCQVLLQHLTGWPRTGFLRAAFPDLKVVNVVRDGRAVASSWLQMGWWDGWQGPDKWIYGPLPADLRADWEAADRSFVVLAALGWKMLMRAFADARELCPPGQWIDIRYEDLIDDPRHHVRLMLDFLELDWSPRFEAGLARHIIHRGRSQSFRRELTAAQVAAMDRVLAEPLQEWGYLD
ncbi:MAG TPA: sulfotransferase [Nocardioidaceae bacterium]|nr:sulfotransferase [Nocardioidaceae bacterium]